jgi:hypothetical protein
VIERSSQLHPTPFRHYFLTREICEHYALRTTHNLRSCFTGELYTDFVLLFQNNPIQLTGVFVITSLLSLSNKVAREVVGCLPDLLAGCERTSMRICFCCLCNKVVMT